MLKIQDFTLSAFNAETPPQKNARKITVNKNRYHHYYIVNPRHKFCSKHTETSSTIGAAHKLTTRPSNSKQRIRHRRHFTHPRNQNPPTFSPRVIGKGEAFMTLECIESNGRVNIINAAAPAVKNMSFSSCSEASHYMALHYNDPLHAPRIFPSQINPPTLQSPSPVNGLLIGAIVVGSAATLAIIGLAGVWLYKKVKSVFSSHPSDHVSVPTEEV